MCDKETGQISVPYFSGSGFLLITDLTVISRLNKKRWGIKIKMRPQCTNCVILWTGQNRSVLKGDFLLVGIDQDGYPYVSYDLGGGTVTLTDRRNKLTKNTLQIIRIHRTDEVCVLKTGATETFEMIENTRGYTELNSNSGLYIGGHPEGVGYTNYKPFVGCIISLSINDLDIPMMMRAAYGEDIQQCHSAGT
ncbi:hypothetical protein EB796_019194 [Bugula neritina]|uniref:Laminin G domain-containing protein n=1 Tax=Bugula neritina TaxID=10212 RepID=A0A7J7J8E3_BUGNE|nr:hypothetical protein EB796_019194 [Bugula neritina]